MRTIRLKLGSKTVELLDRFSTQNRLRPAEFAQDLCALVYLRGSGIPTPERLKQLATIYAKASGLSGPLAHALLAKRVHILRRIAAMNLFTAACAAQDTAWSKTCDLLIAFTSLGRKAQESQCNSCLLKVNCEFGIRYGNQVSDISIVTDSELTQLVNEDCPHFPQLSVLGALDKMLRDAVDPLNANPDLQKSVASTNDSVATNPGGVLAEALATNDKSNPENGDDPDDEMLADPDMMQEECPALGEAPLDAGNPFAGVQGFSYQGTNFKTMISAINSLSAKDLALFELANKLDLLLATHRKGAYSPSPTLAQSRENRTMTSLSDLPKSLPSELAMPDEILDQRIAKSSVTIRRDLQQVGKRQALFILLDVSLSMRARMGRFPQLANMEVDRSLMASTLALSLVKRVQQDKGVLMLREFATGVSTLATADEAAGFDLIRARISRQAYHGSGTSIVGALTTAIADFKKVDPSTPFSKAEILLITDGEDYHLVSSESQLRIGLGNVVLNVLDLSGRVGDPNSPLRRLADTYLAPSPTAARLEDFITIVGTKKKGTK